MVFAEWWRGQHSLCLGHWGSKHCGSLCGPSIVGEFQSSCLILYHKRLGRENTTLTTLLLFTAHPSIVFIFSYLVSRKINCRDYGTLPRREKFHSCDNLVCHQVWKGICRSAGLHRRLRILEIVIGISYRLRNIFTAIRTERPVPLRLCSKTASRWGHFPPKVDFLHFHLLHEWNQAKQPSTAAFDGKKDLG